MAAGATRQIESLGRYQKHQAYDACGFSSRFEARPFSAHETTLAVQIGTSGQGRSFDETVVKEMAKHVDRPIIFPMSNPTKLCEADPADLVEWTEGRALIATGSPFPPVENPKTGKTNKIAEYDAHCSRLNAFPRYP